jgi:hypothetical protein
LTQSGHQVFWPPRSNSLLLFNESFGSTNEREGSEIANQIVNALLKVFFVAHLYHFAYACFVRKSVTATFLWAERRPDGTTV